MPQPPPAGSGRLLLLLAIAFFLCDPLFAQETPIRRLEALGGIHNPAYPFTGFPGLFYKAFHPGFQLGLEQDLRVVGKHAWIARLRAGVVYHRFIQVAVPIAAEAGYRHRLGSRWAFDATLGAGYLHSFPLTQVFKLQSDGTYRRANLVGRPQATLSLTPGFSYNLDAAGNWQLLARYQIWFQLPYIRSYVPLLPYSGFQMGLSRTLSTTGRTQ